MSFVPAAESTEFSVRKTRQTFENLADLKYPEDARRISRLSLAEKQVWYAGQDPQALITIDSHTLKAEAAGKEEKEESDFSRRSAFSRFWYWHYILPLKIKRAVFTLKFW